ncbi:hypothetical protein HK405_005905 [Cladochytrium tenue]|nr:hypothetical protein HK405_005905 [Cladochytrium tenue]
MMRLLCRLESAIKPQLVATLGAERQYGCDDGRVGDRHEVRSWEMDAPTVATALRCANVFCAGDDNDEDGDINDDHDDYETYCWSEHALELFTDMKGTNVARFLVAYQPLLYFPILALPVWRGATRRGHVPDLNMAIVELTTLALNWVVYLGTTFLFCMPLRTLLYLFVSQTACGVFLAVVFSVNHVLTCRDVTTTPVNDWFTGGLNYQIEHHMFEFHAVRPLVESLCRKHGVPYHSTSLWNGLGEIVTRLASISRALSKIRRHRPQQ